jgi:peptidyl-prolyl cis-trans isomerase A (cyclophilin A)
MIEVMLETTAGRIAIAVFAQRAPLTAAAFLALIEDGSLSREGSFYRTVRSQGNDPANPAIDVIQGGLLETSGVLRGIPHESTRHTGLAHLDGTVSLARDGAGTATGAAFFICLGEQPALDAGGTRIADGLGFAAFGQVMRGMESVRTIHRSPTSNVTGSRYPHGQSLDPPVRIVRTARI